LMNLLRYAALLARQRVQDGITLSTLAAAFDKRLAKHLKTCSNPFVTPSSEPFVAPSSGNGGAIPAYGVPKERDGSVNRRRRRKTSVSEVLTAK
jgi:hypothetical protein